MASRESPVSVWLINIHGIPRDSQEGCMDQAESGLDSNLDLHSKWLCTLGESLSL